MRKVFLFLFVSILVLALVGCSETKENDKVRANSNNSLNEDNVNPNIQDAREHFVFTNYIKNLFADDLNGQQISMELYVYTDEEGKFVESEYYKKDILRIGKTQDENGVLTFDFEASRYDNSIPKISNITLYRMAYDGKTFRATHPKLPGFEFESSAEIELETAREYYEEYSFKESTNRRFVDILTEQKDLLDVPIENIKETTDGYIGVNKSQIEFTAGPLEGRIGEESIQVTLDKEYNFTGLKIVSSCEDKTIMEMTIKVTDFK